MIASWSRQGVLGDIIKNSDKRVSTLTTDALTVKLFVETEFGTSISVVSELGFVPSVHKRSITTSDGVQHLGYIMRLRFAQEQGFKYSLSGSKHLLLAASESSTDKELDLDGLIKTGFILVPKGKTLEVAFNNSFVQQVG